MTLTVPKLSKVNKGIRNVKKPNSLKVLVILVLSLALIGLATSSVFAKAVPEHNAWTTEFTGLWVWNQCTDEWLVCEGTARYAIQEVTDSSGGYHWMYRGSHNFKGVVPISGNEYQVISTEVQHLNVRNGGFPYEWTFINTSPLISHGKDANMRFNIRNKVTVNANGDITVSFCDVWIDCQCE
mgnify:CR=1 FL=1